MQKKVLFSLPSQQRRGNSSIPHVFRICSETAFLLFTRLGVFEKRTLSGKKTMSKEVAKFIAMVCVAGQWQLVGGGLCDSAKQCLSKARKTYTKLPLENFRVYKLRVYHVPCPVCTKHNPQLVGECYHCHGTSWI
jgi:hypothetical protein